ncbi:GRB10-interacting GYF protein 1 [Bombina bombina]|uniref:GRB10-interacting GYF protein 1 n=1 Tax=Bombina bombina TaxID=8345 RepID=UPI00235AB96E|nr:GRB10-interacting GYF protein 1 [Bombina bombina]XP_053574350.1 GRB10-interacting GYF protein 1 [Bombina bombina]
MAAETLNFGPEWLRALSSGGSVVSPPPSPAMPKYKLAEYRYGREEMLALYVKENKVPEEMQDKEFAVILNEEPLQPLALLPLTEEEQRNFSLSVNSVPVLRLMGKGGAPPPGGVSRGRGTTRGRGRGRGDSAVYPRAADDGDSGFGRGGREIHRSQSWDDRGERRFEKPIRREAVRVGFEEAAVPSRKEFARSDSDNWRTLRDGQEEDDEGSWRLALARRDERWRSTSPGGSGAELPRSAGWREHGERRRKFDFDVARDENGGPPRSGRGGENSHEDERDGLPEWCMDDEDDEMGTFDSTGAFMSFKKCPKDTILEEQEFEFLGVEEEEEEKTEEVSDKTKDEVFASQDVLSETSSSSPSPANTLWGSGLYTEIDGERGPEISSAEGEEVGLGEKQQSLGGEGESGPFTPTSHSPLSSLPPSDSSPPLAATEFSVGDPEEDEGMKHLQQEAEKLVASLQDSSLEEDSFSPARSNGAAALPLTHEAAMKWFYKDPQGEIQGPFNTQEMAEWCQAGYFTMSLLVKRGCDEGFQPLGEVIKMWGRVPFAPGPSPPPLLGNIDQQCLKKQQELALYQQLQHQYLLQIINRQQYSQQKSGDLTPQQQQQLTLFLQQLNPNKSRGSDAALLPSMNRSLSVPDTGSLWDLHTSASQTTGGESALWDLPVTSASQGPILEQLQLQQKLQERRDVELRAKREEEERKRREEKRRQEEQKRRDQEEELFRRKQCRQQQELLLKLLQQSGQPSSPPIWGSHGKGLSFKTVLEMQEREGQLLKQRQPNRTGHGGLGMSSSSVLPTQWGSDAASLWGGLEKSPWEESVKTCGTSRGLRNSRSSPSLTDTFSASARRKKTEEEEKLLKLLQGIKPSDGFTQWCEQMLHILNTSNNLDVPTLVAILKELESPYDVHDFIRSYLGETLEAKEFAKQFLERRAKYKASQRQQEASWFNPSMFPSSQNSKPSGYDAQNSKMKRRIHMLHSDPSILGYSLHGSPNEMEAVDDY